MAQQLPPPPSYDSVALSVTAGESSTDPDEVARTYDESNPASFEHTTETVHQNGNTDNTQAGCAYSQGQGMGVAPTLHQSYSKSTNASDGTYPDFSANQEQEVALDSLHQATTTDDAIRKPRWDEIPTSEDEAALRGIKFEPVEPVSPNTCYNRCVPYFVGLAVLLNPLFGGIAAGLLVYKVFKLDGKPGKEKKVQHFQCFILVFAVLACCTPITLYKFFKFLWQL